MDRRSWLWRRKSSETESSGSVSSHSERFSEDQEGLRVSSVNASPNNTRSPEISSKLTVYNPNETMKSLNEKLSAALLSITAKEELVQQHVKVAEEAVTGWEKAEADVAALKKQLEVVLQKNSALEDRTKQLDAALKECVRQRRQSREEQEQIFREALSKKMKEWENEKFELETQIIELQAKLEVKAETASSIIDHQMCLKHEELEQEKYSLQIELLAKTEDLHLRTLERDLSTQAAETASKQHLESIRKLAKVEAECRKLQAANRKSSPLSDHIKQPCSESIADKATNRNLTASTVEINLMDDFLEMERLAALPEGRHESSSLKIDGDSDLSVSRDGPLMMEVEDMHRQSAELKQKIVRFEADNAEMEMVLSETRNQLKISCDKLIELQQELSAANGSKHIFKSQMEEVDAKKKELESQLKSAQLEISELNEKASFLEGKFEKLESKIQEMESVEAEREALAFRLKIAELQSREMETQLRSAKREVNELHTKVQTLEGKLKEEEAASATLAANMEEEEEANRKKLRTQLESANMESVKLKERIRLLEEEVEHLQSRLSLADFEVSQLNEKVTSLERIIDEERASFTEFKAEAEANMEVKKIEVEDLHKKVNLLERKVEEESANSAGLAASKEEMETQLELAHLEKSMFAKMSIKKQEDKNMLRKERDFVMASEMFAACQKTIDSISQQLKTLSNFDELMLEPEKCGLHLLQ